MNGLNGIILNGKIYELSERGCFHCSLVSICKNGEEFCNGFPYPNPEKDHCFRFSQELTDKLNGNGIQQKDTSAGL